MKIVIYYLAFVAGLIILSPILCRAQGDKDHINKMIPKPVPASPNAASLGKYGDYQVSHFTGLPDISIPIYDVQTGELKVPITLSYHASGIKPTDVASWVGAGWSLSAGGQISQNVRGKNDSEHYLNHAINEFPTVCGNFYYLQRAARQVIDTEPDIFSYSYPGGRGKFLFPNGSTFVSENQIHPIGAAFLIPYAPILVNRLNDTKFEITDERGVLYRYGTSSTSVSSTELTTGFAGGIPTPSAYTLNLMEMKSPNSNDDVTFKYQAVGSANTSDIIHTYIIRDECDKNEFMQCPTPYELLAQKTPIDSRTNQQGLSEILFENGKVKFILGSLRNDARELKYLDRIEIYSVLNGTETKLKTVQFLYSYFTDANNQAAALKLDAVHMLDNDNISVQKYKFQYFTNSFSWNRNDINFFNARDLWGYYNGATQNTDLLLPKTVPYQVTLSTNVTTHSFGGAVDRTAKEQFLKEGVLKKIEFPTGGSTEFEFECNKYFEGSIKNAGGLRVTKIKSSAGTPTGPITKSYKYGLNESGYGVANFNANEFNYSSNSRSYQLGCDVTSPFLRYSMRAYYANSAFSLDGFDSSPVRYPYVTEYNGDSGGVTLGKTIYEFDNGNPQADDDVMMPNSSKIFRKSFFWKRGKLTKKTVFDNVPRKLSETTYTYSMHHETANKLVGLGTLTFQIGPDVICPAEPGGCINEVAETVWPDNYSFRAYYLASGAWLQTGTTEKIFQNDNELLVVARETSLSYDADKLQVLQSITSHTNQNEESVTVNTYPFQLTANAASTGTAQGAYMLKNKNILTVPIETYTYLQRSGGTNRRIVSGQVKTFKQNPANVNYVVPDKVFILSLPTRLSKSSYSAISINGGNNDILKHSNYQERVTYGGFDSFGNMQSVSRTNEPVVSYKWGYNNTMPVAEVTNALPKDVFYNSFEEATSNFWWEAKAGRKGSVGSSGYLQALSALTPGAYLLSYYKKVGLEWQYNETVETVPANGTFPISLPPGQYDEIRFYPQTAQIKTFTHELGIGISSTMDTNGVTTFFEYDSFGRLKIVRDNENGVVKAYDYHYKLQP